jgi:hypothetical protein
MKFLALLLITLPLTACCGDKTTETPVDPVPAKTASISTHVQCGCTIESVGQCGNFVEIDTKYIPIANDKEIGLGHMEWCKQGPVAADVAGEVVDGKFVATKLDTLGFSWGPAIPLHIDEVNGTDD